MMETPDFMNNSGSVTYIEKLFLVVTDEKVLSGEGLKKLLKQLNNHEDLTVIQKIRKLVCKEGGAE